MRIIFRILFFLLFSPYVPAAETETIRWMIPDFPPVGIAESEHKELGIENAITGIFADRIPEYRHIEIVGNLNRIYEDFREPTVNAGIAGIIRTPEREEFMLFAEIPSVFLTALSIIIRTGEEDKFGVRNGTVSLQAVLENKNVKLGIPRNYTLTEKLTAILRPYIGKSNVYQQDTTEIIENLLLMMDIRRIDYTIAYPWMTKYMCEKLSLTGRFRNIHILEDDSPIIYYPAFTKSGWGGEMASRVEKILRKIRPSSEYRGIVERWLDKDDLGGYRQLYEKNFLSIR